MVPETYFVSISPLFFDPFKATNGVQSNQTYVQILGKFAHRSPSNFEILTSVTSGYLGHTLPIWPCDQCSFTGWPARESAIMGMMPTHTQPAV